MLNQRETINYFKKSLEDLKTLIKENSNEAERQAIIFLTNAGIIDENKNLNAPYNGEKANPDDFTMGPQKIIK